jgi:hypothetical protein
MSSGFHFPSRIAYRAISYSWWYNGSLLCRLIRSTGAPHSLQHDMGRVTQSAAIAAAGPAVSTVLSARSRPAITLRVPAAKLPRACLQTPCSQHCGLGTGSVMPRTRRQAGSERFAATLGLTAQVCRQALVWQHVPAVGHCITRRRARKYAPAGICAVTAFQGTMHCRPKDSSDLRTRRDNCVRTEPTPACHRRHRRWT